MSAKKFGWLTPVALVIAALLALLLVWMLNWHRFGWAPQWEGIMKDACEREGDVTIASVDFMDTGSVGGDAFGITIAGTTDTGSEFQCFTNQAKRTGTTVSFELVD